MDNNTRTTIRLKYTEVVGNHFAYRGTVDDHKNSKRHVCGTKNGLSLDDSWMTNKWENKVFAFILVITEVNVYLAMQYFTEKDNNQLEFWKKISHNMVYNASGEVQEDQRRIKSRMLTRSQDQHNLIVVPAFSCFMHRKWGKKYRMKY